MTDKIKKITKNEIIDTIYKNSSKSEGTKLEKKVIQEVFDSILAEFKSSLTSGATVELRGFGTFEPRLRNGRENARNPRTGETINVEPHYVAAFRPGMELKKALLEMPVEKK